MEGVQVAVVDADEVASGGEGAIEFGGVVDFDEDVELKLAGAAVERSEFVLGEGGDDEEDSVGAVGAGFEQLEFVEDEVFAEAGDVDVASDASSRLCSEPWKNCSSVRTERQAAPAFASSAARLGTSKSARMSPLEGEAFFSSAMMAGPDWETSAELVAEAAGLMRVGRAGERDEVGSGLSQRRRGRGWRRESLPAWWAWVGKV